MITGRHRIFAGVVVGALASGCERASDGAGQGSGEPAADAPAASGAKAEPGSGGSTAAGGSAAAGGGAATGDPANGAGGTGTAPAAAKAVAFPTLDFVRNPAGLDTAARRVVALTFDDGPDGSGSPEGKAGTSNTTAVLDTLKALGLKGTFFLCARRLTNLGTDPKAGAEVRRMVAEGHDLANHTSLHRRFSAQGSEPMTAEAGAQQLQEVQDLLASDNVLGAKAPQLTMYRMPYGVPYQGSTAGGSDQPDAKIFAPITAKWGVHVGWGIDTHDWECANSKTPTTDCVLMHLRRFIKNGSSGVVLMHAISKVSADALPLVVAELKAASYQIVTVEDMIKQKYGASSAQLAAAAKTANFDAATLVQAAEASMAKSEWVVGTNPD